MSNYTGDQCGVHRARPAYSWLGFGLARCAPCSRCNAPVSCCVLTAPLPAVQHHAVHSAPPAIASHPCPFLQGLTLTYAQGPTSRRAPQSSAQQQRRSHGMSNKRQRPQRQKQVHPPASHCTRTVMPCIAKFLRSVGRNACSQLVIVRLNASSVRSQATGRVVFTMVARAV